MPDPSPPRQYVVAKPTGDADAARRLATAYADFADDVTGDLRHAVAVLDALGTGWQGTAAAASKAPADAVARDAHRITTALRRSADDLRTYAHRLDRAHQHHGWSLGKLVALGAMVTVGAAAVVVTVGAAAPAEACAVAAAVETAEAAAAATGTAAAGVAGDLTSWQALLSSVRPLLPMLLPHVVSAGSSAGLDAASELLSTHRLNLHALEVSAAAGFAGSSVGDVVERRLLAAPVLARRAAEGAAWSASGAVASYADSGDVELPDVLALGLTGVVARDVRYGVDEVRLMWKLRVPQLPLGFANGREWRRFVTTLHEGLDRAGYSHARPIFQGSSVTGRSHDTGLPFDAGRRSDFDIAIVDPRLLRDVRELGITLRSRGSRSPELWPHTVRRLRLAEVQRSLSMMAGRKVNFMIYRDVEAALQRPSVEVPRP